MTTSTPVPAPARAPASVRALRLNPVALEQRVAQLLRRYQDKQGRLPLAVLLVRAEPVWDGAPTFEAGGRSARVVPCVSPLAVLEQVAAHAGATATADHNEVLVVLTDQDEAELGSGVLSQVLDHRVHSVEPWPLVQETFGAQKLDPRLQRERWAAEALVDAMPPGGWPRLAGTVLNRDVALRYLAARRLGLERIGVGPDDLDAQALLRWSASPGAAESFTRLRTEAEVAGRAATALFALANAGHGADALALGLVCGALWAPAARGTTERAQGRVDRWFGDARLDDATVRAFAEVAEEVVADLLAASSGEPATTGTAAAAGGEAPGRWSTRRWSGPRSCCCNSTPRRPPAGAASCGRVSSTASGWWPLHYAPGWTAAAAVAARPSLRC